MAILPIATHNLYYEIHGIGKPLVLISGLTRDYQNWTQMLHKLQKNFQVIIFDNRGVGQYQDTCEDFTLEDIANDVVLLLQHLNIKKAHIFGHSLGGMVAQILAVKFPDFINKIILANTTDKVNALMCMSLQAFLILREKTTLALDEILTMRLPWIYSNNFLDKTHFEQFKKEILAQKFPQSLLSYSRQVNAVAKFDYSNEVSKIMAKTLVIGSKEDALTNLAIAESLQEKMPNSKLAVIPGGHCSQIEAPGILTQLIEDFLIKGN